MLRVPSGSTDRYLYFVAVDSSDLKTREPGLTSFTVYRSRNGAAEVGYTTPTITEIDATNMPGVYALLLDEDTTLASGHDTEEVCLHITQASMAPVTIAFELYRPKITEGETVTASSSSLPALATAIDNVDNFVDTEITALQSDVTAIKAKTDNLPSDPADQSALAALIDAVDNFIDTEIADIQARLPAALVSGRMDSSVGAMAANTLTASALAADAVAEIAAALGAYSVTGTADSGTTTTMVDSARTEADVDYWAGALLVPTSGNIAGQARMITGFDPTTDTITFTPATTQAWTTNTYIIIPASVVGIDAKLGAFTGAGANTVLGLLRAIMRKDVTAPTDVGGTFDPRTDSEEAIRDHLTAMAGPNFNAAKSGLSTISSMITQPSAASSAPSAGSTTYAIDGWIASLIADVRRSTNEPSLRPTYTDAVILAMAIDLWGEIWADLNVAAERPLLTRYPVDVVAGVQSYWLPPSVGEIVRFARFADGDTSGLPEWEHYPNSFYNPCGPGYEVRGNVLTLTPIWTEGMTMHIDFVPGTEIMPHEGMGTWTNEGVFQVDWAQVTGTADRRPNAYGGFMLRVFMPNGRTEDRFVASSTEAGAITISPSLLVLPSPAGPLRYELVPFLGRLLKRLLALRVAMSIHAQNGNRKAHDGLLLEYTNTRRGVRLKVANVLSRRAGRMEGDVSEQ